MRRFQLTDDTSDKFWTIERIGSRVTVVYGQIGAAGRTLTKDLPTEAAAISHVAKLVAEKTGKGYVEDVPPPPADLPPPPPPPATAMHVMTKLGERPGDELFAYGTQLVHRSGRRVIVRELTRADVMTAVQNFIVARGSEGFTITHETVDGPMVADLIERNSLPGDIAVTDGRWKLTLDRKLDSKSALGLLAHLGRVAPRTVQVAIFEDKLLGTAWDKALEASTFPTVRAWIFDHPGRTQARQRESVHGDLSLVLAACPSLHRLFASGASKLTASTHDSMKMLFLLGDPLPLDTLLGLAGCRFPALERLGLAFSAEDAEADAQVDELPRVLDALGAPALTALHLRGTSDPSRLLEQVLASKLLPRLRTLSIEGGSLNDGVDEIPPIAARHAAKLAHLEQLALPIDPDDEALRDTKLVVQDSREPMYRDRFLPAGYAEW